MGRLGSDAARGYVLSGIGRSRPVRKLRKVRRAIRQLFSARGRRQLLLAVAGSVVVAFFEMLGVAAMVPLMDLLTGGSRDEGALGVVSEVLGDPNTKTLATILALVVFGAFLLKGLLSIGFRWWVLGFMRFQQVKTSVTLLQRYLSAPYWLHLQRNVGSLLRTMNDAVVQTYRSVTAAISIATEIATTGGIVLLLLVVSPVPAIVAVAYFLVAGYFYQRWTRRQTTAAGNTLMRASSMSYGAALQALGGVKEIKVRRSADHFLKTYRAAREESAGAQRVAQFLQELPRYMLEILFTLGIAVMTLTVFATNPSQEGIAILGLFVAAGVRLLPGMVRIISSLNAVRVGKRGISMVLADLSEIRGENAGAFGDLARITIEHEIRCADLSFQYRGAETPVLQDVDFTIAAGTSFGIVGGSGAGKSTLIDLLLGLHEPTMGSISVDGVNIAEVLPGWQRSIGMVPQEVYLLDDSLRANIAFGQSPDEIDSARIAEVVELAQLEGLVAGLPEGLDSHVGERGVRLSGGQRQRIGIARALYLSPQLLVLDEATSSLDNETEHQITETIDKLQGRMTVVVVAHRLSTVRRCDRLMLLNNGTVGATGTFDELRRTNAEFARLVELGSLTTAGPSVSGTPSS
jgi:ATP-binding cassette, subfamily B, bacterial PglK